jgi:hypothetical protein
MLRLHHYIKFFPKLLVISKSGLYLAGGLKSDKRQYVRNRTDLPVFFVNVVRLY